jgi:hypothetical protein
MVCGFEGSMAMARMNSERLPVMPLLAGDQSAPPLVLLKTPPPDVPA